MERNFTPAEEASRRQVQDLLADKLPARLSDKVRKGK